MYSICYVLADNEQLKFYNEFMISVSSLRSRGFEGSVYLFTDRETYIFLSEKMKEIAAFSVEVKTINVPDTSSRIEASRFIKTSLRKYVSGDFLYIDTDTVIAGRLPEIISVSELALVPDRHYEALEKGTYPYRYTKPYFEMFGINDIEGRPYYNSGVIWVKDTPYTHLLYERWHKLWEDGVRKGIPYDQPALNAVIWESKQPAIRLDDAYNTQVSARDYIDFKMLSKALIIHYYSKTKDRGYLLKQDVFEDLSYQDEAVQFVIQSPKTAFSSSRLIETHSDEYTLMNSLSYRALYFIYRKRRRLFHLLERTIRIISGKS